MIILLLSIFLNYFLAIYLVFLWGSLESISTKAMLKEPALYTHLFKFQLNVFPIAIFFPFIYLLGLYIISLFGSIFLGILPSHDEPLSPIYIPFLIAIFTTPLIAFTITFFRSKLMVHCAVCDGQGKLDERNEYLGITFDNEICFCCKGKKTIWKKSEIGKSHTLLQVNLLLEQDKISKIKKLKKEKEKLSTKLEASSINESVKNNLESFLSKIDEQIEFQQAAKNFYKTAVEKLIVLLYNKHLAEYVLGKTKEFYDIEEQNIATYADTESKKYNLSDTEIVDKIEALVQEISLRQNLSIVKELQKELEASTEKLKIK